MPDASHPLSIPQSLLHLLIVEDVAEDIELILLALESAGISHSYDTADTEEICQRKLNACPYDAVLADYRLPHLNGLRVLEILQQSTQDIPFILVTGSLGEEAAVACIKAGMTDYVLKDRLFRLPSVLNRALAEFELRRQQKQVVLQLQQQAWKEAIVSRIVQAMRETLVLGEVLQTTADQLHEALQVDRCSIFTPDSKGVLCYSYVSQLSENRSSLLHHPCKVLRHYQARLSTGQSVILNRIDDTLPHTIQVDAYQSEIQATLTTPLIYQQQFWGGISLQMRDRDREWTVDERALLKTVADQCAIAIHQARLYEQAQTELAERMRIEAQLRYDAFHDALTGLPNRALLMDRLEHAMKLAQRRSTRDGRELQHQFAVIFLDLDDFKVINDSLGHVVGDQLLKLVATSLAQTLRPGDTVARIGGDEFVLLLEGIQGLNDAVDTVHQIQQVLKSPLVLEGHDIFVSASMGITLSSETYSHASQFLRDADTAMYRAKAGGRGRYEVFISDMHTQVRRRWRIENELRRAIKRQELRVYYQPIVSLATNQIAGFEALARWQHPEQGLVSPSDFIPIAEATGLIVQVDQWVMREACHQLRIWQQRFQPLPTPLTMGINISGKHFEQADLVTYVDRVLQETGLDGRSIKLEVTESILIENSTAAQETLKQLKQRGIQIYIDDFGTGYSSLSYLHKFSIDVLKIDRSFISRPIQELEASEVVRAIINLGLNLGLEVVAEGVETAEQVEFLKSQNCSYAQGNWFSEAVDAHTIEIKMATAYAC